MFQIGVVVVELLGNREVGKLRVPELDLDVRPFGNPEGVVTCVWQLAEEAAHLMGALQIVLVSAESEPVRIAHK